MPSRDDEGELPSSKLTYSHQKLLLKMIFLFPRQRRFGAVSAESNR